MGLAQILRKPEGQVFLKMCSEQNNNGEKTDLLFRESKVNK